MTDNNDDSSRPDDQTPPPQNDNDFKLPQPSGTRKRNPNPPPKRKSSSWPMIIILIVAVSAIGLFSLVAVGAVLAASDMAAGPRSGIYNETVIRAGEGKKKVVVIPINGILLNARNTPFSGGGIASTGDIIKRLRKAGEDENVFAIVLDINSPGGEITATDEIHREIQKIREKKIRVVTCMRSVAASGGYYIAAGTDYIVANRLTLTGSVGVIMGGLNYSRLFDKIGLKSAPYKSGQMKDMGSPSRHALSEIAEKRLALRKRQDKISGSAEVVIMEKKLIKKLMADLDVEEETRRKELTLIQGMVDKCFLEFAKVVADGRKLPIEKVKAPPIGDARVMSGVEAKKLGLVDQLGYFEDAVDNALGGNKYRVIRYDAPPSIFDMLGAETEQESPIAKLIPPEMNVIKKGRMYYLNPNLF